MNLRKGPKVALLPSLWYRGSVVSKTSKTSSYLYFEEYNTAGAVSGRHCQAAVDMVVLHA